MRGLDRASIIFARLVQEGWMAGSSPAMTHRCVGLVFAERALEKNMACPPVHDPAYGLSAEALEYARQRYEETEDSQRSIAEDIGKSRGTLDRIAKAQGWKLRKDQPPRGLSEALKLRIAATEADEGKPSEAPKADLVAVPDAAPAGGSVAERLEAALERELRKVENLRADLGRPTQRTQQSDRIARTLATLTETLFRVRRLREPGNINGSNDDDLPSDADGFRLALAHRIDVFVRSRIDASVSQRDKPADGEPPAS
jgi:hypothetical protein